MRATRIKVSADGAIRSAASDAFGMKDCAERFSVFIEEGETPLVISIKGEWGSGKSSLINLIVEHLNQTNKFVICEFDAWRYRQEANLALPLMTGLAAHVNKAQHKALLRPLVQASLFVGSIMAKPLVSYSDIKSILQDSDSIFENYEKSKASIDEYHDHFKKLVEEIRKEKKRDRIVIVVENLDRCLPDDALSLIEQIQNFFKVPNVVFLLALDESAIEAGLRKRLGVANAVDVQSYLDKIIDISLVVPEIGPTYMAEYIQKRLASKFIDPEHVKQLEAKKDVWKDNKLQKLHAIRSACNIRKVNRATNLLATCIANDWDCTGNLPAYYSAIYLVTYYPTIVALSRRKAAGFVLEYLASWTVTAQLANTQNQPTGREALINKYGDLIRDLASDRACLMLTLIVFSSAPAGANAVDYMLQMFDQVERYIGMGVGPHG